MESYDRTWIVLYIGEGRHFAAEEKLTQSEKLQYRRHWSPHLELSTFGKGKFAGQLLGKGEKPEKNNSGNVTFPSCFFEILFKNVKNHLLMWPYSKAEPLDK